MASDALRCKNTPLSTDSPRYAKLRSTRATRFHGAATTTRAYIDRAFREATSYARECAFTLTNGLALAKRRRALRERRGSDPWTGMGELRLHQSASRVSAPSWGTAPSALEARPRRMERMDMMQTFPATSSRCNANVF
jgi:hypothetical protein